MAEDAVSCELLSCPNSLLTGKNTGISRFRSYHSTDKLQPERRVAKNTQHSRQSEQGPIRETTGCQFPVRRSCRLAGPTTLTATLMSPFFWLRRTYRVIAAYLRGLWDVTIKLMLRKINRLNKRFWSKQSKLTSQRISDPMLYALATRDMHSEAIRVAFIEQQSLDQAVADAEQSQNILL